MTDLRRTTETTRHDFAAGETGRGPSVPSGGLANDPKAGQWDGRRDGVRCAFRVYEKYIYTHSRGYRLTLTMMLAGRDGRLFLSVVPGASHQYADIAGVDETMDWIRTLADQLTG